MQTRFIFPLVIFVLIVGLLMRGLALHPNQIPSPLIDKPAPQFSVPTLYNASESLSNKDFLGHVTLLNVWATWCYACAEEHALLLDVAQKQHVIFYGLNYKDNPEKARNWLQEHGNPYKMIGVDLSGDTAIDWGVYGTPETFIIDKHGVIRYKQIGSITPDIWDDTLKPIIKRLQKEP
jgi:cytochrome c biogenesis protein CcmG/thiol:disulfide interchange protein DsbE